MSQTIASNIKNNITVIHNGDNTHIQLQAITFVSFSIINTMVRAHINPIFIILLVKFNNFNVSSFF